MASIRESPSPVEDADCCPLSTPSQDTPDVAASRSVLPTPVNPARLSSRPTRVEFTFAPASQHAHSDSRSSLDNPQISPRTSFDLPSNVTQPESCRVSPSELPQWPPQPWSPSERRYTRTRSRRDTAYFAPGSLKKQVRRPSSSSIFYYMQKPSVSMEMPLGIDMDEELSEEFLEIAKKRAEKTQPQKSKSRAFQIFWFALLLCTLYFGFVGFPLWNGIVYSIWIWVSGASHIQFGFLIFFVWGTTLAWLPLIGAKFEKDIDDPEKRDASETCLLIPAYKAAGALPATIEHALKIFKPHQIFIIANGNSPTPLDDTEQVCKRYGVHHAWVPIGSKITAEYVGVLLARDFKYALLIDDDVHLPANLPLVTDRINEGTTCIGYSIKSTGANGAKGTLIQQAQDLEYKLSGLSRHFGGTFGSAVFPHGAIILWDRNALENLFWGHPGFKISEDWYFGHTCRAAGQRIKFCTQVFVETETPPSLFIPVKSDRGGYGEMTVWKQRFYRWNFFYLYRLRDDLGYLLFAWRLGRYEIITKLFVLQEVYETFLYAVRPFMLPIMFAAQPKMSAIMTAALIGSYVTGTIFFNAVQLRRKKEMVAWNVLPVYFLMKWALTLVNSVSIYYALYEYATFFSSCHPRVTENYDALKAAKECLDRVVEKQEQEQEPNSSADISLFETSIPEMDEKDYSSGLVTTRALV